MKRLAALSLIVLAAGLALAQRPVKPRPRVPLIVAVNAASYTGGRIGVTNGSTAIVGTGTVWTPDMTGRWLNAQSIPALGYQAWCPNAYQFTYVDATHGTLDRAWGCQTGSTTLYWLTESTYIAGGLGTSAMTVQCWDSQVPANSMKQAASLVYANYDVEILWFRAAIGYCVLVP
jgi:hypothetical protein